MHEAHEATGPDERRADATAEPQDLASSLQENLEAGLRAGVDRVQAAVSSLEGEMRRLQKEAERRRRSLESLAQNEVARLRAGLKETRLLRAAEGLREGATERIGAGVEALLASLDIATGRDLKKLDRKLSQLNRRLRDLEKPSPRIDA